MYTETFLVIAIVAAIVTGATCAVVITVERFSRDPAKRIW